MWPPEPEPECGDVERREQVDVEGELDTKEFAQLDNGGDPDAKNHAQEA